jgi:hypothetical protein
MKKLLTLLAVACFCIAHSSFGQTPPCGFDHIHKKLMAEDPAYARTMSRNDESIQRYIAAHPELRNKTNRLTAPLFTIPVVVHVVHTGGPIGSAYNPSDAQIFGAIDYLNQVYAGTYPGTQGVGEIQIQFALAQRDPNCNPTNGIDRVNGSGIANYTLNGVNVLNSTGASELSVKNLSRWNTANYYNIWVVHKIDGNDGTGQFIAGFAYFPGSSSLLDGTMMLAATMVTGEKTLPHEIGHALNLYHPFEGSLDASICPANANCATQGDRICDTDPISFNQTGGNVNFSCRTGPNVCVAGSPNHNNNTEHNYMNYTICYDLFTADQKARMLAAMTLPSRASLATSPGATPTYSVPVCAPKINFELSADAVTESTVTTSGCRYYRDYTFNMVIGSDPSTAATATIAISAGTATEGVDYDITTNGNFASPSKVVSFPAASHNNQPFTIRIYDDAGVESVESFTLNFTVNNGGGNAVLGEGKPTLTITINDNDTPPIVPGGAGTGNIGSSAGTINVPTFDARLQSQRTHIQYRAAELTAAGVTAGNLTGISFNLQKASTRAFTGLTIKMGTTTVPNILESGVPTVASPMTTVKTLASYTTINGWNDFTLDVPFVWNGTSNLVVEICFNNAAAAAGDNVDRMQAFLDGGSAAQGNMLFQANINCSQAFSAMSGVANGIKPITRITYSNPGNPVATTTVTSLSQYLGPNADVYFYSNTGQIMARVTNLTSFDYGCTQVSIDRTGTSSAQFWNSTTANYLASKSFRIISNNNTTTGHYQVHLYYSQAEINGWQSATGQTLAGAQVIKVSNGFYVPDVTASTPHMADVMVTGASNTAYGTDFSIMGDFNNTGFSGFGVGIPGTGTTLPVTLLSFNGHREGKAVKLEWKTASELNGDRFEIETSKDINQFYTIGTVRSRGNTVTEQQYSFTDNIPVKGVNYYRLKQVDIDGRVVYSNTVSIIFDEKGTPVIAYPNPTREKLTIELAQPVQSMTLQILTLEGKLVRQLETGAVQRYETIDTRDLSNGVYVLQIKAGTDIYNLKFVKN